MPQNPATFVRVSTPEGHFTMPAAIAERGGVSVLKQDALDQFGHPLPAKPRTEIADTPKSAKRSAARKRAAQKPRVDTAAATPTQPEASASGDTSEE